MIAFGSTRYAALLNAILPEMTTTRGSKRNKFREFFQAVKYLLHLKINFFVYTSQAKSINVVVPPYKGTSYA